MKTIYIRGESNPNERRAPVTPQDAKRLIALGCRVKVSASKGRCFPDEAYREAGCIVEPAESWREPARAVQPDHTTQQTGERIPAEAVEAPAGVDAGMLAGGVSGTDPLMPDAPAPDTLAPDTLAPDTLTVGIKVPALDSHPMYGAHLFFAHQYTRNRILWEKPTATRMLNALRTGGGVHYDMEFLTDESGARVTAFSTIAGYVGTAIALTRTCQKVRGEGEAPPPYAMPTTTAALRERAAEELSRTRSLEIAVISPSGACGKGACDVLSALGLEWTAINHRDLGTRVSDEDLFAFDLLVNCMAVDETTPAILTPPARAPDPRLTVVADIGCETNDNNPLRLRESLSSLDAPFLLRDIGGGRVCDILAVDHLPALTPRESSEQVSAQLFPLLANYISDKDLDRAWLNARNVFKDAISRL